MSPVDREDESEERERPPSDASRTARIAVGVVGVLVLIAGSAAVLLTTRPEPGCGDWEVEFDELSESLAAYVRSKGVARVAALDRLDGLKLRCGRVEEARALCAGVYRDLHIAEVEHAQAKQALAELERSVATLQEPTKSVAELRFIESKAIFEIAEDLELTADEVRQHIDIARETIGTDRLETVHARFEKAVNASKTHVTAARDGNETCDAAYKRLLEEEQRR